MSATEFLATTPVEVSWRLETYEEKRTERRQELYILGRLSSLAFSEEFPEYSEVFGDDVQVPLEGEELEEECKAKGLKLPDA
jgi:hypothetical protein